ncbi:peptidoglycan glycosyltransferase [Arcanobacterium wilhelmae]|uniref:Peptidoglycan glycosyltransferase n=1 Tax=Arcanobacterium wilhelmae TaxID=1803177 RepID=A0ABT9NB70_9ACTO|nr:penicillin-binding protein 2 [Arcanobacterium wilhelmae]MDP9800952.1 peptidoglycan glycosyltransferase [Arcanobacterium wilhelmae]WFN90312.1 penicillin-binding protein 2 [Arcanobacterium wilhelmae]
MNPPLRKLTAVVLLMFLTLMAAASYIQFFRAPELNADSRNVRTLYREYGTDRGPIVVAGKPIAGSESVDDPYKFLRTYADGPLYAPITGYFSVVFNAMTALERQQNSVLGGSDDSLLSQRISDLITGKQPSGGGVELTINPAAQKAAWDTLGNRRGAVVAIEPETGRILALVSRPSFDPNLLASHKKATAQDAWKELNADERKPLLNRAIGGDLYAPGSSFKIITAAAMLENGATPDGKVAAPDHYTPNGTSVAISNPGEERCGDGSGQVPLRQAFLQSCNTTFAKAGHDLGYEKMNTIADALGFGKSLSIPLQVRPSRFPQPQDLAALAQDSIGQRDIQVSPLQMAMVAAAVANKGVLMKPYLVESTMTSDLATISTTSPSEYSRPFSAQTASALREMMIDVVNKGTGGRAALKSVQVAGKTGTAEIKAGVEPHSWFVGFDATDHPKVAVAAFVENGGDGGYNAGPIAAAVIGAVTK